MTEHRWSKFWWQDYESDLALRLVSLAAQGLWMRMMCTMHGATPHGHLTLNGKPMSPAMLGRLVGVSERVCRGLLDELEAESVFSRTEDGVIYSRRMVRDKEFSEGMKEIAKRGGNPEIIRGTVPKEDRIRGYKRSDSPLKTERIFQKKRGHCWWCDVALQKERPGPDFFQVDHVIAVRDGGTNDEDNLVPACAVCNHKRARHQSDPNRPTLTGRNSDPNHLEAESEAEAEAEAEADSKGESAPRAASPPRQSRGSRLPVDWQPSVADIAYAEQHAVDWQRASERFRNYWHAKAGKGGVMLDWAATWRNWVLRDAEQPKPKLHTLPAAEQDRRILVAAGLNFTDPPQPSVVPMRIAR